MNKKDILFTGVCAVVLGSFAVKTVKAFKRYQQLQEDAKHEEMA
jgi:hypothetical protein